VPASFNSPVANAYVYSHLGKRDNIVGDIRKIPILNARSFEGVERAASAYLAAAFSETVPAKVKRLQLTQNRWRRALLVDKAVEHFPCCVVLRGDRWSTDGDVVAHGIFEQLLSLQFNSISTKVAPSSRP
jgi:hypothetical protein